jgi:hypothetical protein
MLKEAKTALRIRTDAYDADIARLIKAGATDLEIAGVVLPGSIAISEDPETGDITDASTLTDDLCVTAILTYVRANFGSPEDYDRVKASYDEQKVQLMHASGYTDYEGGDGE